MPWNVCGIRACAYARVPALHGPCKLSTYRGKVRVRPCVPRLCALEGALLGATCMYEPALFPVQVQVHVIVRVGFCAVRAHERFGQCASAVSLCSTARGQEPYCTSPRAVRASQGFRFCVLYEPSRGASLQRLCASVYRTSARSFARCEPTKAFVPLCTVRAPRTLRGASLQRLCASVCCTVLPGCNNVEAFIR